jgi:hypothetical protein
VQIKIWARQFQPTRPLTHAGVDSRNPKDISSSSSWRNNNVRLRLHLIWVLTLEQLRHLLVRPTGAKCRHHRRRLHVHRGPREAQHHLLVVCVRGLNVPPNSFAAGGADGNSGEQWLSATISPPLSVVLASTIPIPPACFTTPHRTGS